MVGGDGIEPSERPHISRFVPPCGFPQESGYSSGLTPVQDAVAWPNSRDTSNCVIVDARAVTTMPFSTFTFRSVAVVAKLAAAQIRSLLYESSFARRALLFAIDSRAGCRTARGGQVQLGHRDRYENPVVRQTAGHRRQLLLHV